MNISSDMDQTGALSLKTRTLASSVGIIVFLTILSRPFGIVREMLTAAYFGTRWEMDIFLLSSSIPVFLCIVLGGGLVQAVVPAFSLALEKGRDHAWRLLTALAWLVLLFSLPFIFINIVIAPWIIRALFHQAATPVILAFGVQTYRLLSLAILGGVVSGLVIGAANTLHCYGHTTIRSMAYNVMIMTSLILLHKIIGIYSLAIGLLLAEFSQIVVVFPPLWSRGYRFQMFSGETGDLVRIVFSAFIPAVILNGMGHVNYLVDRILALPLGEGSISALHYAWRLILVPASLLSVAFATPLLSFLSRHEARQEREQTGALFIRTVKTLLFFSLPITFLVLLANREIVSLVYGWGRFGAKGAELTSSCLFFYSPGLPFQLLLPVCIAGFLAVKKPWVPVLISLPMIPLNWLLDVLLMGPFRHAGIALSTSLIYLLNVGLLLLLLKKYLSPYSRLGLTGRHILFLFSSFILFGIVWGVHSVTKYTFVANRLNIFFELIIMSMITLMGYGLLAQVYLRNIFLSTNSKMLQKE
jgi:putative peptidoglycan lipid II flippase